MEAVTRPDAAGAHQRRAIEPERDNGGASCGGSADDARRRRTPTEMLCPNIETRIEQGTKGIGARIKPMSLRLFEIVAPETAQAEVVEIVCAVCPYGRDVVDGEIVSG